MKSEEKFLIGMGILASSAIAGVALAKTTSLSNKLDAISKGLASIEDNVDISIPEDVADMLIRNAAEKVANNAVEKASSAACKDITDYMDKSIKHAVEDAYTGLEDALKDRLEKEINLKTIERIEEKVSEKVAKQIVSKALTPATSNTENPNVALIKTCADAGMSSYEIQKILEAAK